MADYSGVGENLLSSLLHHCRKVCEPLLPNAKLTILLMDEEGRVWK
jgi:cobalt-precorrin-5B (C1)-methyltransferase